MNASKAEIRRGLIERRRALSAAEVAAFSERAQEHVLRSEAYARARAVALYAAFANEVRTDRVLGRLLADGKAALFSRLRGRGPAMDFCRVTDLGEMVETRLGYLEPGPKAPVAPLAAIDLMLVPGVGFDREGYRIGFGYGCYDRLLAGLRPEALTCGLCYGFQVMARLPREAHDVPVKTLVTEAGFIPVRRNG